MAAQGWRKGRRNGWRKNGATECGPRVAQIVAQRRRKSGARVAQEWRNTRLAQGERESFRMGWSQGWRKGGAKSCVKGGRRVAQERLKGGARVAKV